MLWPSWIHDVEVCRSKLTSRLQLRNFSHHAVVAKCPQSRELDAWGPLLLY